MTDLKELNCASVKAAIQKLYYNNATPSASQIQEVLDLIETEPSEKLRAVYFAEAKTWCSRAHRDLIPASRWRANKFWEAVEASKK